MKLIWNTFQRFTTPENQTPAESMEIAEKGPVARLFFFLSAALSSSMSGGYLAAVAIKLIVIPFINILVTQGLFSAVLSTAMVGALQAALPFLPLAMLGLGIVLFGISHGLKALGKCETTLSPLCVFNGVLMAGTKLGWLAIKILGFGGALVGGLVGALVSAIDFVFDSCKTTLAFDKSTCSLSTTAKLHNDLDVGTSPSTPPPAQAKTEKIEPRSDTPAQTETPRRDTPAEAETPRSDSDTRGYDGAPVTPGITAS